jgi:myo-inositol-1(or 4)-monophosphatase
MNDFLSDLLVHAGGILMRGFGRVRGVRRKGPAASVVCDSDLASEAWLVKRIRSSFPEAGIIAEEMGCSPGSGMVFVIDPLDGTSNFVSGLPWFGVQVGVLRNGVPQHAAMYLPVEGALYVCSRGKGVWKNGKRMRVTPERSLKNVLCAFGMDSAASPRGRRRAAGLITAVAAGVRNVRTTNSLYDFCYTLDGKLGGCVNLNCKIWDIVPVSLMLPEAGGVFTDLAGAPIEFEMNPRKFGRSYAILGASAVLHPKLRKLVSAANH